jgi:hypothetical protein
MSEPAEKIANGTIRKISDKVCVYYDGYWIRYYAPPEDTLAEKKRLIVSLTRRTFHHTEPGINTPGENLELARQAYLKETDPARKRVKGAMLAGALFNRGADIFNAVVNLASKGVLISEENELMKMCGECLKEALDLGKLVKHYSGEEGIDELWGEPFKAFSMPMAAFYESRYLKIAQAMRNIDYIAEHMAQMFETQTPFKGIGPRLMELAETAKEEAETMRTDKAIFDIWPRFVAALETVEAFEPRIPADIYESGRHHIEYGMRLLQEGKEIITYLAGARVPMPKTTKRYVDRLDDYTRAIS